MKRGMLMEMEIVGKIQNKEELYLISDSILKEHRNHEVEIFCSELAHLLYGKDNVTLYFIHCKCKPCKALLGSCLITKRLYDLFTINTNGNVIMKTGE
jgi:hypothetical protein